MLRKILIISLLAILPLIAVNCSNSGSKSKASVTLDLSGTGMLSSATGPSVIQKASEDTSVLPTDIDTIQIKATTGDVVLYDQTYDRNVIADSSDSITIDIPSGTGINFVITAYDTGGIARYSGTSNGVEVIADAEIAITIALKEVTVEQDALITLSLKELDSNKKPTITFDNASKPYLRATNTIKAEVVISNIVITDVASAEGVAANKDYEVTTETISTTGFIPFSNSITGLTAFPNTFQLITVKAFSIDGTLAAIGAMVKTNLKSDSDNAVDILMLPPGRLNIYNSPTNIKSYSVEMEFVDSISKVATWIKVAEGSSVADTKEVLVSVPNCRTDIGKLDEEAGIIAVKRNVRITINNETRTTPEKIDIVWKQYELDFQSLPLPVTENLKDR